MDFGIPVEPDEHAIIAAWVYASFILVHLNGEKWYYPEWTLITRQYRVEIKCLRI